MYSKCELGVNIFKAEWIKNSKKRDLNLKQQKKVYPRPVNKMKNKCAKNKWYNLQKHLKNKCASTDNV